MARLRFGLLGPTIVIGDDGEIRVSGLLRRRLLTRLLVDAGRPVGVDRLIDDLWGTDVPRGASSTLKSHVSLLRRSVGIDRIAKLNGGYVLHVVPDELDLTAFTEDVRIGRSALSGGDPGEAARSLARGLARWRGPVLADVADLDWARPEATRVGELHAVALESWLEARLALGETDQVVAAAQAAVSEHPLRERRWGLLITALYRSGRQADALRAYQRVRRILLDELGIAPGPELAAMELSVLRQEPALAPPAVVIDLREPPKAGNLPVDTSSFIGRRDELTDLTRRLARPGLLTLVGPGGTGKTRLAIQAARLVSADLDAVWLSDLSPFGHPDEAVADLGRVLGCIDGGNGDLADLVGRRLAPGRQMVILDNCEHLLDGAADLAARLRRDAPQTTVLATSRSPLLADGEVVYRVGPLAVPPSDATGVDLRRPDSIRLFVERAAFQQPLFVLDDHTGPTVAAICRRLDGLPLSIELAAARLRSMSVIDIERRLDDRFRLLDSGPRTAPSRQRTLRALIDWSYDLLDEPARVLLTRLAVFNSAFDLEAAEAVAGPVADRAAQVLASLVDMSLVQFDLGPGASRYRLLETIRDYALTHLGPEEEAAARHAHATHFHRLACRAMPHLTGPGHAGWRAALEADDENLRAALATIVSGGVAEPMLTFAAALCRYWISRGRFGDEMALVDAVLAHPNAGAPCAERGDALAAAAFVRFRRGETRRAEEHLVEALAIATDLGLPGLAADALRTGAWVADRQGAVRLAAARADDAVRLALASGSTYLIARAYDVRGATTQPTDPDQARRDYEQSLLYSRQAGDVAAQASTLNNLAVLELERGDHRAARRWFDQAFTATAGTADPALGGFIRYGIGLTALLDDDPISAESALLDALTDARRTGQRSLEAYALLSTAITRIRVAPDREGAVLLGAALTLFDTIAERPEPTEAALCDEAMISVTLALGDDAADAVATGRSLPPDEVMELVLSSCRTAPVVVE